MSETKTIWHPYPKEKPKEEDEYLVTVSNHPKNFVHYLFYSGSPCYSNQWKYVIAWAELPEPYEDEVRTRLEKRYK